MKHIFNAFSLARDIAADATKTERFLIARADIIKADGEEAAGLTWLTWILGSDDLTYSEKRFPGQLENRLFPNA